MRRIIPVAFVLAALAFALLSGPAWAQSSAVDTVQYYVGDRPVELQLATDEVYVRPRAEAGAAVGSLKSLTPNAQVLDADGTGGQILSLGAVSSRVSLDAQRSALESAGYEVNAILYTPEHMGEPEHRKILSDEIAVGLGDGVALDSILAAYPVRVVRRVENHPGTYILESTAPGLLGSLDTANAIRASGAVAFAEPQIYRKMGLRLTPNDTFFNFQWHLLNSGSNPNISGSTAGNDINVSTAWDAVTGEDVNIAIVDDGLEVGHEDLAANVRTDIDLDINGGDNDPSPGTSDFHGTACAGVAAAVGNNNLGVIGAAFEAGLVGVKLIAAAFTDAHEKQAFEHQMNPASTSDRVHISSNSWGPIDTGTILEGPGSLALQGLQTAIATGRGGRGTIFVWAGGNGRNGNDLTTSDNSNKDGYANSRYTIAVAASGANGVFSPYSERGACILVNAPSDYLGGGITTVDRTGTTGYNSGPSGNDNYTQIFGGTSSACPLVAGVVALILDRNSNLTWRDVQHILVETAEKNDPGNADWFVNDAGYHFNHNYGFGRVDAAAAVSEAQSWNNVPPEATPLTATNSTSVAIPDNSATGVTQTVSITSTDLIVTETVEVKVNIAHTNRGDLDITLTSPQGTVSKLAERHHDTGDNYTNWTFSTVANWGESPEGTWTLKVADNRASVSGTLTNWTLTVHGFVNPTQNQAVLQVDPIVRSVGSAAGTTTFDVSNTGVNSMPWTAAVTQGIGWLTIPSGFAGTDSGTITAAFTQNTSTTSRLGEITVSAPGAAGSPKVLTIEQEGVPNLSVTPTSRVVSGTGGSTTFNVSNTGGDTLNYTATVLTGGSWLTIDSGGTGTNNGTIGVTAAQNPASTSRSGTIRVTAPEAPNSPVDVTVEQTGRARLALSKLEANFTSNGGQEGIGISNTGGGTLNWTAVVTSGPEWLSLNASNGTAPGTLIIVAATNGSTSPRMGTVQVSSAGSLDAPQTINVTQAGCVISTPPQNVIASDGAFTDRVRISWSPVSGATQYWVYRALDETLDINQSQVIGITTNTTTFDDLTVGNKDALAAACGGSGGNTPQIYYYSVSAVSNCGEGPASPFDSGFASGTKSLQRVTEMALPSAGPADIGSSLSLRVLSNEAVDPTGVWATIDGKAVAANWTEAPLGGWITYVPDTAWEFGQQVTMQGGATTVGGVALEPVSAVFQIGAEHAEAPGELVAQPDTESDTATATLAPAGLLPDCAQAVSAIYVVSPQTPFAGAKQVWLPLPAGVDAESVQPYCFVASVAAPGWYPADQVSGFLAGPAGHATVDGQTYIVLPVLYGSAIQLGAQSAAGASVVGSGVSGNLLVLIAAGLVLLVVRQRRRA